MDKDKTEQTEKIKDEEQPVDPLEWLNHLVEQNQDDVDFIVNAQNLRNLATREDNTNEINTLKEQLDNERKEKALLKKKYYDTFMGTDINEDEVEVIEKEEKTPLTLTDIENKIKGVN